ncbi:contact-dependent growth inhibition system immunity protein [Erwinia amylovora]|uniref:Conserved uncharcterized protein n=1 Tax=Erwinia amylovora ATCC BAA-2158 TaxID=889211 RepID=E5B9K8_ERWAM|nr:contact-dependent growth inhibition system immunity protein [Erwinia amylovora]CBX82220.1 conserved uncharcterized protein [Erwinia amylovora ATCC BAA-2158]
MNNYYPLIENLMRAYLNQDYDYICESETIEGAIDYYIRENSRETLMALNNEIDDFIVKNHTDTDSAFEELFHPEVIIVDVNKFFELFKEKIAVAGKA